MAVWNGTSSADTYTGTSSADTISGLGGGDTLHGGAGNDIVLGGDGYDVLYGDGGNDFLSGEAGKDTLIGGAGADKLHGGAAPDVLNGSAGNDTLWGGVGNDQYVFSHGTGIDTINDDKSPTGAAGYGGGSDDELDFDQLMSDLTFLQDGDDLWITTINDAADGTMDSGVIIEGHYLGGDNRIEWLVDTNGGRYWLPDYD